MMKMTTCGTMLVVLLASPAAYGQVAQKPAVGYIAGGYAAPVGQASESIDPGWNLSGGATLHFDPKLPVGLRLDFGYARFNVEPESISGLTTPTLITVEDGYTSIENLSLDVIYDFGGKGHVGGYLSAGIGGYSRYQTVTRKIEQGPGFCDPLVQICQTTTTKVTESDRLSKLGYDLSVALTFPLHSGNQIYVEGRYHWMDSDPATEFVPVVIGYRW